MTEKRDYLFDNIKGLIIFLVVWEHFCGETIRSGSVAGNFLCTAILLFHMSVMMFVSGYFTKNLEKHNMEYNIRRILIPYFVMCLLYGLAGIVVSGEFKIEIFNPTFAMWYIVVLFFYRLMLPYMVQVKGILVISFVIALASGMFPSVATYHTLGRFLTNLPFFLMGYYCSEDFVNKLRGWARVPEKLIYAAAFLVLTCGTTGLILENKWDANVYRNNTTYAAAKMTNLLGMETRILFYLVGIFAILCFLTCCSRQKTFLCKAGRNSMVVYFFHIFVYEIVRRAEIVKGPTLKNFGLVTLVSVVTVWVLSWDIWSKLFHKLINGIGNLIFRKED